MNGRWRCSANVAHCHVVGLRRQWITALHDGDSASCRSDANRGSGGQQFFRELSNRMVKFRLHISSRSQRCGCYCGVVSVLPLCIIISAAHHLQSPLTPLAYMPVMTTRLQKEGRMSLPIDEIDASTHTYFLESRHHHVVAPFSCRNHRQRP